jgi:phenylacetic acid degradation protein
MLAWKTEGTTLYQALPAACFNSLQVSEPLKEPPPKKEMQKTSYTNRKQIKK